jgi:glycosyltransferase involved in cell wall biosynthesis
LRIFGTVDTFIEGGASQLRLGRLVANARFLVALIQHSRFDAFHFFCPTVAHVHALQATLERELGDIIKRRRISLWTHLHLPRQLRQTGYAAFHVGGWGMFLPRLAHLRAKVGGPAFPLTGVTHSLHTADIFSKMREMVATPFGPGDAVVCTSVGGQQVMQRHWDLALQRTRAQGSRIVAEGLRFPRIPLAVEDGYFEPRDRQAARRTLGLCEDDVMSLYLGRLSPHTKADLNPVIDAHARIVRSGRDGGGPRARAHLVLAGAGDPSYQAELRTTAAELGIADRVHVVTNVSDEHKQQLLAAADLFVSPVDNHQETFGLAVVEAMAAGLPVVASDFDGYRDLVDEGVTGFRVPTYGGRFPASVDDLVGLLDPNLTALLMAETVALDNGVLRARMGQLIDDPNLRRRLGAAGRERARRLFAWPQVIAAYEALWDDLGAAARSWTPTQPPGDPQVGSLHDIFAHYPTALLGATDKLRLGPLGTEVLAGAPPPPLHHELLPLIDPEMGTFVLRFIASRAICTLGDCVAAVDKEFGIDAGHTGFQVIWLLKQGLLIREPV